MVPNFVKIGQNAAELWQFKLFKMASAAILDFWNFKFLTVGTLNRVELHHLAKFRRNRSNRGWDITIFRFFQDSGHPPSWICNACVGTTHEWHLVVFITVQNLVGIDAVVLIICTFFDFASSAWKRLFAPQNWEFSGENRGRVQRYWPPTNSFLLLGVYTSVSNLVKIDEKMRPWECPQTDRHTHAHTSRTDAKRFYYLSHAICYSYGADKNNFGHISPMCPEASRGRMCI